MSSAHVIALGPPAHAQIHCSPQTTSVDAKHHEASLSERCMECHLRSRSLSRRRCSLAVALSSRSRRNLSLALSRSTVVEEDGENSMIIFRIKFEFEVHTCTYKFCKSADLKFPVSGRSIDRQTDRHTRAQSSHASVGLAQARPN